MMCFKYFWKFVRYQLTFLSVGMDLGTSFRLIFWIILNNIYLEFVNERDFKRSKKKWDQRYWYMTDVSFDPFATRTYPVDIPEKYIYAIVTDIITRIIRKGSLYSISDTFKVFRVTPATKCMIEAIVDFSDYRYLYDRKSMHSK